MGIPTIVRVPAIQLGYQGFIQGSRYDTGEEEMANEKRRYCYVDFTKEPVTGVFAKATHAVATSVNTQQDYTRVGDQQAYFEWVQIGASTPIFPTASATGWALPMTDTDATGIAMSQGIVAGDPTNMKFVTGTDAFFMKVRLEMTTVENFLVCMIGFRELAAYAVTTTSALALTDYDHKALIGVMDALGAVRSFVSTGAGADVSTVATNTPVLTGVPVTWEVHVGVDLSVTFKVNGVADPLLQAATPVLTTGRTLIPHIIAVDGGAGALGSIELVTYECGLSPL